MTVVNSSDILNLHIDSQAVPSAPRLERTLCACSILGPCGFTLAFQKLPRRLGILIAVGNLLRKLFLGRFEYCL